MNGVDAWEFANKLLWERREIISQDIEVAWNFSSRVCKSIFIISEILLRDQAKFSNWTFGDGIFICPSREIENNFEKWIFMHFSDETFINFISRVTFWDFHSSISVFNKKEKI